VIATKFGLVQGGGYGGYVTRGRPHYVRRACGASLKRLGTDHIDPHYQHRSAMAVTRMANHARRRAFTLGR
jgi:aryl-alcohol dehydrogenase-like predicted oxidoreductase